MNAGHNLSRRGAHLELTRLEPLTGTLVRTPYGPNMGAGAMSRRFRLSTALRGLSVRSSTPAAGLVSLARFEAPQFDQGQTGSCNPHRTAMALATVFAAAGHPLPFIPSPAALYRVVRALERAPNVDGTFPPLTDTGCATVDMITALATVGIEPCHATPSVLGYTDVDPIAINDEPKLDALEREAATLTVGEYAIDLTDTAAALNQVQAALLSGYPVWIDAMVDTVFETWGERWSPSTPVCDSLGSPTDPNRGGHALLVTEMQVGTDGSIVLSGPNSWGAEWGAPALASDGANPSGHFRVGPNWFGGAVFGATVGKAVHS